MAMHILGNSPELTLIFDRFAHGLTNSQIRLLGETFKLVEGVKSVQIQTTWFRKPRIRVVFNPETEPYDLLRKMATAIRSPFIPSPDQNPGSGPLNPLTQNSGNVLSSSPRVLEQPQSDRSEVQNGHELLANESPAKVNRLREAAYGVLAMGSFVMSWVGLIVPGIPTVPFVLLTAHFALQASPSLRERLLKSRMFGPMIRDWQQYGAIHRVVQIEAYVFTIVIIIVGFIFSPPIPILYVGMGIASVMGLYVISQIPVIESSRNEQLPNQINNRLQSPVVVA